MRKTLYGNVLDEQWLISACLELKVAIMSRQE